MELTKYKIGDLIEVVSETNSDLKYNKNDVVGITITKEIIPTKANVSSADLSNFTVIKPNTFIYNPRTHGKKIGFGYNNTKNTFIISFNNMAFKIKESMKNVVLSDYLFLHFRRDEWDRQACYNSWGSSTEVFSWDALCDMQIELPSIDIQQKYINIYNGLIENQKSYEKGLDDLKLICDAYIENLRKEIPCEKIGKYIEESNLRNLDKKVTLVQGVENTGSFIDTRANMEGIDITNYKIVNKDSFAYNPSRINLGSIALRKNEQCIISPMYIVFHIINDDKLDKNYLFLWLTRKEFFRSTLFFANGSVRDTFDFTLMQDVSIPIPDIEIQQSIAKVLNALQDRMIINNKLKQQIKDICPILIKGSLEEGRKEA